MTFGGPRSSCVRPGTHSARHQDSRNDLTLCRRALHFVSAGAHAPHSDETLGPTATRGASHSARRLRSLAFLCSSNDGNCCGCLWQGRADIELVLLYTTIWNFHFGQNALAKDRFLLLKVGQEVKVIGMLDECECDMFVIIEYGKDALGVPLSQLEIIE